MASTSTGEQIFQYDVFLNHRGSDTKMQFLLPLTEKLHEAGIQRPFLDQGIQAAERVFHVIEEALHSARMHIAVFSSSYARSQYCLNELQEMLQTGRHIIPVFYGVAPEHVRRPRNPTGPFEEAFRKHSERWTSQVVEGWVAAMEKAAELKGFERDTDKYRGKDELLMKDIVDNVVRLLCPTTVTIQPRGGRYDWISHYKLPTKGHGIIFFAADTYRNLHIALSPKSGMVFPSYEIVIGLQDSSQHTWAEIRRLMFSERTVCSYSPMDLTSTLQEGNLHHFWICVDAVTQLIYVGQGQDLEERHAYIIFKDPSFLEDIQYFALSSNQVAITYTGIRVESTSPTLFGSFGQDSSAGLWSSIDASQVLPPSPALKHGDYDWSKAYELPTQGRGIVSFSVKAITDVRVAISPKLQTMDSMYEMVLGGGGNSASSIRKKEVLCRVTTTGLLQRGRENHFWVSLNVDTQLIHVGRGKQPNFASVVCIYKDPYFVSDARYVSFFSSDADVVYSNIFVASPSGTRVLTTQPLELPRCMGRYNWDSNFKFLSEGQGILYFSAQARNDIHVAISPSCETRNLMYEIVIGGWQNTRSCIRKCSQEDLLSYVDEGFVDPEGLNHYWISIDKDTQVIQVGRGKQANPNSVLFMYMDPCFLHEVKYIAFSTWDTPITYSKVAISFRSVSITKPLESIQELNQDGISEWVNFQLQDPHFKVEISQNCYGHYGWQHFFELPSIGQGMVTFAAETISDVHVAISPVPETVNPMYEIVIGGWNNSKSVIRRASQGDNVCSRSSSPIASGLKHYWVLIDAVMQIVKVGFGRNPKIESSTLLWYTDLDFIDNARYVTFTNFDAPITYSSIAVFQSISFTKPIQSFQELYQEKVQWANFQLQDPHFTLMISQSCLGDYGWHQYFELPSKGQRVVTFAAETITDVHVAISPKPKTMNPMYEIVIGGWNNSKSVIRRTSQGDDFYSNCSSPIAPGLNHYWVSIDAFTQLIKVGFGRNPMIESSIFLCCRDSNFISDARYITFSNWNAPVMYSNFSMRTI